MIRSIGVFRVTVPGTLKQIASTAADLVQDGAIHGILLQALPGNTGVVYIGGSAIVRASYTGLYGMLGVPALNAGGQPTSLPTFTAALTLAPNAIKLSDFYIDADQANDGVIASVLIA